jgi:hypothetical protein
MTGFGFACHPASTSPHSASIMTAPEDSSKGISLGVRHISFIFTAFFPFAHLTPDHHHGLRF